jgi:hypothetical protein
MITVHVGISSFHFEDGAGMTSLKQIPHLLHKSAAVVLLAAAGMAFGISSPSAQSASPASGSPTEHSLPVANEPAPSHAGSKTEASAGKPYYIEFRSRSAQSYGHTFSIYGRLNGQGKIASKAVAGLHPFTESPLPWMVGHLILVPSETGASDGDTEDQYVTARFRVALSQAEYAKVTTFIKDLQKKSPLWHAVLYNCNAFVGDIAHFMGLETPSSTMLMPAEYINGLRDLNISRAAAAGVIGTPVRVEDSAKLRAQALKSIEMQEKHGAKVQRQSKSEATAPSAVTGQTNDQHKTTAPASSKKSESGQAKAVSAQADLSRPNLVPTNN